MPCAALTVHLEAKRAVKVMGSGKIKHMPVVRGREVVGILSRANLVHALAGLASCQHVCLRLIGRR